MPDDVKLPGLGEVPKKYLLWGGIAAAGIIGVIVIRGRANASAGTPADTTGTTADTSGTGTDGSSYVDPGAYGAYDTSGLGGGSAYDYGTGGTGFDAVGYPIGSQADIQWQAQQYGGITGTATQVTTNSQWVTEALGNVPGDSGTVRSALSHVLAGLTVTTAQKDLFLEAVALNGQPPQGYPQPIKTSDTAAHPGTQDQNVKIPVVTGEVIADAQRELAAVGLKSRVSGTIPHGKTGLAKTQSPKAGTVVKRNSTVTLTVKVQ